MLRTGGFAFFPTNADFREGIIGGCRTRRPQCADWDDDSKSDEKSISSAQSASSGIFAAMELTKAAASPVSNLTQ